MTTGLAAPRRAWVEQVMGLPVSIHVRGEAARTTLTDECVQAAYDELRAVDQLFSTYRPDSEVNRIDRGELDVAAAHPLVTEVLDLCQTARLVTGGAFDAHRRDRESGRLRLDPTGLVKGWAMERAATQLAAATGCDVSVNAGGDVAGRVADPAPAWRVGVEDPRDRSRLLLVVPLRTGGVATSGTAARGQHIVRPGDGGPVVADLLSVTVVGPSLTWADVFATAAFVHGEEAPAWIESIPGYEGLAVDRAGVTTTTAGLEVIG